MIIMSMSLLNFYDMLESTAMVLLQSLNHLHRLCFQLPENFSGVRDFLEEFLSKWSFTDKGYHVLTGVEANIDNVNGCDGRFVLGVDEYLEVVEVYIMKLLGTTPSDVNLAITWVEKAELPEDKRQGLLRRLHSLLSVKATYSSQGSSTPLLADNYKDHSSNLEKLNMPEGSPNALRSDNYPINGEKTGKQVVLRLSKWVEPCFWLFRTINLRFGNAQEVI